MIHAEKLLLEHADAPFKNLVGTSAVNTTKNISTMQGDGPRSMPHVKSTNPGFALSKMVKIQVNGVDYWKPAYVVDA